MKKIIVNLKVAVMYTLLLKLQCILTTHCMAAGTCTICAATKNTMNLKSGYAMLLELHCTTGTIGCKYMYLIVKVRIRNFRVSPFWFCDAITMCDDVVMREIVPFTN